MGVSRSPHAASMGCAGRPALAAEDDCDEWEISRYHYLRLLLASVDTPTTVDVFADAMLAWERNARRGSPSKSWSDVHQELFDVDLPVLAEVGPVEFDPGTGTVATAG